MPKGPIGERRPTDVIGNAVKVMRIATGGEPEYTATRLRSVKQLLKVPARAVSKGAKPERLERSPNEVNRFGIPESAEI